AGGFQFGVAAEDAELVALGVGQDDPAAAVGLAQVDDLGGAMLEEAGQLLVACTRPGAQVAVDAVLHLLDVGYLDEEHAMLAVRREDHAFLVAGQVGVLGVLGVPEDAAPPDGEGVGVV